MALPEEDKPAFLIEIEKALSALWDLSHPHSLADIYRHRGSFTRLHRLIHENRDDFAKIMGAMAELDVYLSIAQTAVDHELDVFPELLERAEPYLSIKEGIHPLYQLREDAVPNDITFDPPAKKFFVLTGPNEGGKSTFLRMLVTNVILAQIGSPVAAASMEWTPLSVRTH